MKTRTFAMTKPLTGAYGFGDIITFIECIGFDIAEMRLAKLTNADVDVLYAEHIGKPFYEAMREYMTSGPVVGMILECEQQDDNPQRATAVERWRYRLGATDSRQAAQHTLRCRYGNKDGIIFKNVAHGSDSPEAAEREIAMFFPGRTF